MKERSQVFELKNSFNLDKATGGKVVADFLRYTALAHIDFVVSGPFGSGKSSFSRTMIEETGCDDIFRVEVTRDEIAVAVMDIMQIPEIYVIAEMSVKTPEAAMTCFRNALLAYEYCDTEEAADALVTENFDLHVHLGILPDGTRYIDYVIDLSADENGKMVINKMFDYDEETNGYIMLNPPSKDLSTRILKTLQVDPDLMVEWSEFRANTW